MKRNIGSILIIGTIVIGTLLLGYMAGLGQEGEMVSTLFLCFFAMIIAIQVVPALMLFGFLIREIFRHAFRGKEADERINR